MVFMDKLIDTLKTRYEAVLQSSSDQRFYKNVHRYIDFIVKTPKLVHMINESEQKYSRQHYDVWNPPVYDDEENDRREDKTRSLEALSLFAGDYCLLFERIYRPIEDQIINNIDSPQVILMTHGARNSLEASTLSLFGHWYFGKRKYYQECLIRFHGDFLPEFDVVGEENIKQHTFDFNQRTGDLLLDGKKITFNPKTKQYKIFFTLFNSPDYQSDFDTLSKIVRSNSKETMSGLKNKIYNSVRLMNQKIGFRFIDNVPLFGYRLLINDKTEKTEV